MFILDPIKGAATPLLELYNKYLHGLHVLALSTEPRDCFVEVEQQSTSKEDTAPARIFYRLAGLRASLGSLYDATVSAHKTLRGFYEEHGGDLSAFAHANRRYLVDEYGGDDEDWQQDGVDEAGEPVWVMADRPAAEVEAEYGLASELARFFPNDESRGEYLGSSEVADYEPFTLMVAQQSQFGFRQMFAHTGKELTIYRKDEGGEMQPLSLADQIEDELNEDIRNEALTDNFRRLIFAGGVAQELFYNPEYDIARVANLLYVLLGYMLAVDAKNLPSHLVAR